MERRLEEYRRAVNSHPGIRHLPPRLVVSISIQAHPARAHLAEPLAARVGAQITYDPEPDSYPSPWRTYSHALDTTPTGATHRVVIQDDTDPCPHFREAASAAIEAKPDVVIAFFVGGRPLEHANGVLRACDAEESWTMLRHDRWCPAVALAWPVELAREIVAWMPEQGWPPAFRADDEIIGRYLRAHDLNAWATVPSLVEHWDSEPSLLGRGRNWQGQDEGRVAACFIAEEDDARLIHWR